MNNPANPADMEEILSSIRSTLEEESGKVGKEGQAVSSVDETADGGTPEEMGDGEDILDLSESQMVDGAEDAPQEMPATGEVGLGDVEASAGEPVAPEAAKQRSAKVAEASEEMFDIDAFAKGGTTRTLNAEEVAQVKADDRLGEDDTVESVDVAQAEAAAENETAEPAAVAEASSDFDRLLAELKEEGAGGEGDAVEVSTEPAETVVEASNDENEPAEADGFAAEDPAEGEEMEGDVAEDALATVASAVSPAPAKARMQLPVIPASTGLQVALPSEILAEALRPLIKGWVEDNLPAVVERLVAEEISKLVKD